MRVKRKKDSHYELGPSETIDLGQLDVVLMRQDPPFDMGYITTTHLLEHIHPQTLVVNDPAEVRNAPEKLYVTRFPNLMPPTLISSAAVQIAAFRAEHKDIILKPLYGNGGSGVFHVTPEDENLSALLEMFTEFYREPIIAQKYLAEVRDGDRRIILIDGEAAGVINRIPAEGEARANMHVGAEPVKCVLSPRDREICDAIGPDLKARSLIFVGNLVDAVIVCLENPAAGGQTFFVRDGEDLSTPDLIRRVGHALNRPVRLFPVPPALLGMIGRMTGKSRTIERLRGSLQVNDYKIRRQLTWTPPFNVVKGLDKMAAWFKNP